MTELALLADLFKNVKRQGPGNEAATHRALDGISKSIPPSGKIADIGCGTGTQTLTLARHTDCTIIAIDLLPDFLDVLRERVHAEGLEGRVQAIEASMEDLPFEGGELDLIWSEGAIYNMGFRNGLQSWRKFLKPGGYLAVSELCWIRGNRPEELENYWNENYPDIDMASGKMAVLEDCGYEPTAYFHLSQECWWEHFYLPLLQELDLFTTRHSTSSIAQEIAANQRLEIQHYQRFKDYYSYGFFVARKVV